MFNIRSTYIKVLTNKPNTPVLFNTSKLNEPVEQLTLPFLLTLTKTGTVGDGPSRFYSSTLCFLFTVLSKSLYVTGTR